MAVAFLSLEIGALRVRPIRMDAREPSVLYSPVSVVQSNLKAMQRDDVGSCFKFLSPQFRQQVGPSPRFDEKVHVDTRYTPLVGSTGYEVLSALQVGDKRWKVRVRVDNVLDPPAALGRVGRVPFSVEYSWSLTQQDDSEIALDLGQCIKHKKNNYHGIVVGYDRECTQTEDWCKKNGVDALARGRAQPFYNVLVDRKDRPGATMTYVAQENLDRSPARIIEHPFFTTASFTGEVDAAAGVWKPTPMLREQYPRGLDGCWLVDEVAPERSREECDDDAADLDGFSA